MSERRYSPLATLFAATFLFRIGNAVAALALPWFVLSHTKSAAWAGATAASSVIATIIGAWVLPARAARTMTTTATLSMRAGV
nr:hypothetical protein [Escherichia coli]